MVVPAAVGIPLTIPVAGSIDIPAGRPVALQVSDGGVVDAAAATLCEYAEPTMPLGREVVVIAGGI